MEVDKLHLRLGIVATITLWNLQTLSTRRYGPSSTSQRSFNSGVERACAAPTKIDEAAELHK